MMAWSNVQLILVYCQHIISILGMIVIMSGVIIAGYRYFFYLLTQQIVDQSARVNQIRMNLGRSLILGLEFIVAADLIGSTTTPDYYAVGLLAIIVLIRTLLTFSINRELMTLSKEEGGQS